MTEPRPDLALFAGIGFAEALRGHGRTEIGLELSETACRTRAAAGHATVRCDVAQYPVEPFAGRVAGFTAGPPCPPFSKAGLKAGIGDMHYIAVTIRDLAGGTDTRPWLNEMCTDPRSPLTAEPMRWLAALRPEWVVLEQVPAVLPLWELYADVLAGWGYSVATGVVDAASYGAPQHRKRAALVASRLHPVRLPAPTHGPGLAPYVTMHQALGWGYTGRPAPTVTGGGTATGGAEPFGNGSRKALHRAADHGLAVPGPRGWRPSAADCATLQGFRPGIDWQGNAGARHLAIGNALPVPLASALTAEAAGITHLTAAAAA
ncbi:DNA cytosine methyltransferase [Kitasatospora sp. NBC_00070]|uniref:DNA cytosine methyltransferase n=1 Tax=Kitasatospora sp. NBC_00070 TaxID=2975962 RepID=UPI003249F677